MKECSRSSFMEVRAGHRAGAGPNNRPGRDPIYQRDPEIGSDAFTPMNQRRRGIHGEIIEPVTLMQEPTYRTSSEGSGGGMLRCRPGTSGNPLPVDRGQAAARSHGRSGPPQGPGTSRTGGEIRRVVFPIHPRPVSCAECLRAMLPITLPSRMITEFTAAASESPPCRRWRR
jgi:hypothetical protein